VERIIKSPPVLKVGDAAVNILWNKDSCKTAA
jgi:hypothetical protein